MTTSKRTPKRPKMPSRTRFAHLKAAYRSGLEVAIGAFLASASIPVEYETLKVPFTQPEKSRKYTPDYRLPNGILLEAKGLFDTADRQKHLWVRAQHPDLDIRFVFSNPKAKLSKGSPTTYADWCEKHGFLYSHKLPLTSWLTEPNCPVKQAAIAAL